MNLISMIFLALFLVLENGSAYKLFYRGRTRYGLLPPPPFKFNKISYTPIFEENWFVQKLDHFNKADTRTWKQRYFINDAYYKPGGPVFLMIGGEGPATAVWMKEGQWINWAKQFNAMCFQLEHRYYGKSHPTDDMSSENLKYLSSDQALADLAEFRHYAGVQNEQLMNAKWIAFGGSYPGALAAWVRLKYPQLFHASVASSAPLRAVINFDAYNDVVADSLATTGESCNQNLAEGIQEVQNMLVTSTGPADLKKLFRLCDDLNVNNKKDVSNFFASIAGVYQDVVQYNKDNRAFEGAQGTNVTIDTLCSILDDSSLGTPAHRMAEVNSVYLDAHQTKCMDFSYKEMIKSLRLDNWTESTDEGARQWTYQTCTEFGYYQTSESKNQPFGNNFPLKFYINQCTDIFGPDYNMNLLNWAVNETNIHYGGKGIRVSRVIFPNGSIDPWHYLGILADLSPDAPAVFINGTAHCADMYPDTDADPPQLREARVKIGSYLQRWIEGDDDTLRTCA